MRKNNTAEKQEKAVQKRTVLVVVAAASASAFHSLKISRKKTMETPTEPDKCVSGGRGLSQPYND